MEEVKGGCVRVRMLVMGPIGNNVYLLDDGADGTIAVDPTQEAEGIIAAAGGKISAIFITHSHWDHLGAASELRRKTNAPVYASRIDSRVIEEGQWDGHRRIEGCEVDRKLEDGDVFEVGKTRWKALLTPGHTKGGLCFYCDRGTRAGAPVLVSGDTLFCASIGRTDFEGGSMADMRRSLGRLGRLPDATLVLPGHMQTTTIQAERGRTIQALQ